MKLFSRCRLKPQYNLRCGPDSSNTQNGNSGCFYPCEMPASEWYEYSLGQKISKKTGEGARGKNSGFGYWPYTGSMHTTLRMPCTGVAENGDGQFFLNNETAVVMLNFGAFIIFMNQMSIITNISPISAPETGIGYYRHTIPCYVSYVYAFWDAYGDSFGVSDIRDIQNGSTPCVAILDYAERVNWSTLAPLISAAWQKFVMADNSMPNRMSEGFGVVAMRNPFGQTRYKGQFTNWTPMGLCNPAGWKNDTKNWCPEINSSTQETLSAAQALKNGQWFMAPYNYNRGIFYYSGGCGGETNSPWSCSWQPTDVPYNARGMSWSGYRYPNVSFPQFGYNRQIGNYVKSACGYSYSSMGFSKEIVGSWRIGNYTSPPLGEGYVYNQMHACKQFVCNYIDAEEITE